MDNLTILIFVPMICMFLAMLGIMAAVMVFIIRTGKERTQAVNKGWEGFARSYHQSFEKGAVMTRPKVSGEYCQRRFVMDIFSVARLTRGRMRRRYFTRVVTQVESNIALKIERRGLLDNVLDNSEATNMDDSFDERYKVSGDLSPIEKTGILTAIQQNNLNALNLEGGTLTLYVGGFVHRPDALRALYDLACNVADLVGK
jgi:hypothetical protein